MSSNRKITFIIAAVWFSITLINLFKAVHIDDTFHLLAAQHILEAPLSPMSGEILWDHAPKKIQDFNQPPFFFFLMALVLKLFGESIIAMHLLVSAFSLLALIYLYKISSLIGFTKNSLPVLLIGLSPAFVVNQNIMVDIPLLSLILASVYYYLKGFTTKSIALYLLSGIFLSFALLTKYTALPVLVAFLIFSLLSKNLKSLLSLAIPLLALSFWSLWNYTEFNSIHLFSRGTTDINADTLLSYTACLGSVGFFFPLLLSRFFTEKKVVSVLISYTLILAFLAIGVFFDFILEEQSNFMLNILFTIVGLIIILISIYELFNQKNVRLKWFQTRHFLFILIAAGIFLFTSLFAPFCATRHLLIVIPFIVFANHNLIRLSSIKITITSIVLTAFFGITLGISDLSYANYYKERANNIENLSTQDENKVWTKGFWGWQWYVSKKEVNLYHWNRQDIKKEDKFVFPAQVASQYITEEIELDTLDILVEDLHPLTFISTKNARFYHSSYKKPSWNFSKQSRDSLVICQVIDGIDLEDLKLRIKNNQEWYNAVKEKAKEKNISVDSELTLNAKWLMNQSNKK